MDELQISGKRFISSRRIARDNGYTSDYIGQLIRGGKVVGQKVGRAWYVDAVSFESYLGSEGAPAHIADQKSSDLPSAPQAVAAGQTFVQQDVPAPEPIKIVEPVQIKEIAEQPPAPIEEIPEEKIPEPVVVAEKKEESHYVPLHIVKTEAPVGLRYYPEDRPSLPEISISNREILTPAKISIDLPIQQSQRSSKLPILTLAGVGVAVFIFSAVVSSTVSLDLSISEGNAAATSYSLNW